MLSLPLWTVLNILTSGSLGSALERSRTPVILCSDTSTIRTQCESGCRPKPGSEHCLALSTVTGLGVQLMYGYHDDSDREAVTPHNV